MGIERRKNSRVPFQATADIKFTDMEYNQCETENLSVKGICVMGITGHKPGDACDISLALSGTTSELTISMKGSVVRDDGDRTALHFHEIDLDSFYHLKNIVYYNSEDPDVIERELTEG